ncbi:MAG: DNA polymerase III subunit delta' C-terminal domain-containing protein [Ignavibacteriaceae bacterium]|nr:DNA polymerase III subunit delta' C-terminal domain-containing protein [Ignavibacteriaceae bacterium]
MNNNWNGIFGQQTVLEILDKLIASNNIPHAFLFTGINGIGKEYTAVKFTSALNETNIPDSKNLDKIISSFAEPYIKYIYPLPRGKNETDDNGPFEKLPLDDLESIQEELQKKINNPYYKLSIEKAYKIKVNSIRDIKKFLSMNYSDIKFRTVLISDAHLMNEESQNALLKNLEEPPEGVIFILVTPYPGLLRETIRSRCWNLNFKPLNNYDLKKILIQFYSIEEELAESVAPFSSGSVTNALNLIENDFNFLLEKTIAILRYSFARKYHSAMDEISYYLKEDSANLLKILIQMIIIWLNDIQKYRIGNKSFFFDKYKETIEKFNSKFPAIDLNDTVAKLDYLGSIIQNNVNLNLIAVNIIFELSSLVDKRVRFQVT